MDFGEGYSKPQVSNALKSCDWNVALAKKKINTNKTKTKWREKTKRITIIYNGYDATNANATTINIEWYELNTSNVIFDNDE